MSEIDPVDRELQEFESALARLKPAASRVDRDRLMFRLGQQSAADAHRPWRFVWPVASAALLLVSCSLGWQLARVENFPVLADDSSVREKPPAETDVQSDLPALRHLPPSKLAKTGDDDILVMHETWLNSRGVLGVRGLQSPTAEVEEPLLPRTVQKSRRTMEVPALRAGNRNAWREWLNDRPGQNSQVISLQKDSA